MARIEAWLLAGAVLLLAATATAFLGAHLLGAAFFLALLPLLGAMTIDHFSSRRW